MCRCVTGVIDAGGAGPLRPRISDLCGVPHGTTAGAGPAAAGARALRLSHASSPICYKATRARVVRAIAVKPAV